MARINPVEIENAKQEVHRLEAIWRQQGFASPDPHRLEEQGRMLTELAHQIDLQKSNLKSVRERIQRQHVHIHRLRKWLRCWKLWQARHAPVTICLGGMMGTALFGLYGAIIVRPAFGALVCLIGICTTALVLVLQHYRFELGIDGVRQVEVLSRRLECAEKELSCLKSELQNLNETAKRSLNQWEADSARYDRLCRVRDLVRRHQDAVRRYQALLEIVNSRRYQLLHSDWRAMRGTIFETFLREAFEMLGYVVETTKASADQGIDLILTGDGRRIGVQAKGYAESVGNHAVMEAYAGKDFYRCDSCVVVTNSDFTRTARELAAEINCRLIAGNDIPNVINGLIRL